MRMWIWLIRPAAWTDTFWFFHNISRAKEKPGTTTKAAPGISQKLFDGEVLSHFFQQIVNPLVEFILYGIS